MSGLRIHRCLTCGTAAFPRRIWCPTCGGREWVSEIATRGVVTATTCIRRAVGTAPGHAPPRLATVWLDDGPPVVAGFDDGIRPEDAVEIFERDGAPWVRRLE